MGWWVRLEIPTDVAVGSEWGGGSASSTQQMLPSDLHGVMGPPRDPKTCCRLISGLISDLGTNLTHLTNLTTHRPRRSYSKLLDDLLVLLAARR